MHLVQVFVILIYSARLPALHFRAALACARVVLARNVMVPYLLCFYSLMVSSIRSVALRLRPSWSASALVTHCRKEVSRRAQKKGLKYVYMI